MGFIRTIIHFYSFWKWGKWGDLNYTISTQHGTYYWEFLITWRIIDVCLCAHDITSREMVTCRSWQVVYIFDNLPFYSGLVSKAVTWAIYFILPYRVKWGILSKDWSFKVLGSPVDSKRSICIASYFKKCLLSLTIEMVW